MKTGYDGIGIVSSDTAEATKAEYIQVMFRKTSHVYDIRDKKYLGYTDVAALSLEAGAVKIFALLPQKLEGIELLDIGMVRRGEALTIVGSLQINKDEDDYSHTLSIQFFNPSGEYVWIYSDNITLKGHEMIGAWRVVIKDVATDIFTEQEFYIEE